MRSAFALLCCILTVSACASSTTATPTPERLPTRAPTATPTITPFAVPAQIYYEQGLAHQRVGELEDALRYFTWAIQRDPGFERAYVARGTVYLAQGDLDRALRDADAALTVDPSADPPARAYALRGEVLRLIGEHRRALESFEQALEEAPALKGETFHARWSSARALRDTDRLLALGVEYADAHPTDPLRHYYRAWAFLELDMPDVAVGILVDGIERAPDPPALLWFVLGQGYGGQGFWPEAVTAFEAARMLTQAGDNSLAIHSDRPIADLFGALGQAYLKAGRCVDAEAMLAYAISVGAPTSEYSPTLKEATICQTPTPTATPYPTTTPSG